MKRFLVSILTIFAIIVLPYWLYIPVLFLSVIFIPFFWEALPLAYLAEVLYNDSISSLALLSSTLSITALILIIIMLPLRARLRGHA